MIKGLNKQMTIAATSVVTVDTPTGEVEVPITYMSANIQTDGRINIGQAIQNEQVYFQNMDVAKQDYDTFYDYVVNIAKEESKKE